MNQRHLECTGTATEHGKGFCFEARQKRIIIDGEYYFADLVFYNRVLHCNAIVEIKNDEFRHEHIGQLNAYVSYYAEHEMQPGDNPPVGILLCTRKGEKNYSYPAASNWISLSSTNAKNMLNHNLTPSAILSLTFG